MKILIYGSTQLTEHVVRALKTDGHKIIGYLPNKKATVPGVVDARDLTGIPKAEFEEYDIALSLQYDQKIKDLDRCFNLHTGLLPEYGGCDILYHTLKNGAKEQGLTFHKITEKFDRGPIISKMTYPVLKTDTVISLYCRMLMIAPRFTAQAIHILQDIDMSKVDECFVADPTIYYRGKIDPKDQDEYKQTGERLKEFFRGKD